MEFSGFLTVVDILGTFAFAISGAFAAMERKLDPFGILIISFVTAIGGGTLRDIMVGNLPVSWMQNNTTVVLIFSSSVAAMLLGSYLKRLHNALFLFDALGLGLFTIIGFEIGLRYHFSIPICIALGTITACFGGVLRDVLLNTVPLIFQKEIYALACIAGAMAYYLLMQTSMNEDVSKIICILLIFLIRLVSVKFRLALPTITLK
jgi:uncharacterized membrane protein YeiH